MINKKYAAIILSALCLTACGNTQTASNDTEETTVSLTETTSETTTATQLYEVITDEDGNDIVIDNSGEAIEETIEGFETTAAEYDTGVREEGFLYFVQPSIMLYPRYEQLDDWECRDTEIPQYYIYDGEWNYCKELIYVFSNYTDEPVTIDSIQIFCGDEPVSFTNGSDTLEINFTVQPMHKTDYLLQSEDFDYSACESGIYRTVVNIGGEKSEREFYINNCELYSEKHIHENYQKVDNDGNMLISEYDVYAPTFLNEEQQHIFAQANGVMSDWFWCSSIMRESYRSTHTPDDFMQLLYSVFTEEYANELSKIYIDENGNFVDNGGDRGSNICYFDHCFIPVSADDNTVEFKAVVTYCHSDNPYELSFDDNFHYVMKNTENGWRVDRFDVWN